MKTRALLLLVLLLTLLFVGCSSNPEEYAEEKAAVVNTADAVGTAIDVICPRCSELLGRD